MRLLKLTGLLIFMSMLAVGCSDDDEKETGGEPAELYVYVYDASDNYLLEGVDVEFVQNNQVLCVDRTDETGIALCNSKWDGLVAGSVTINIQAPWYKYFTKTVTVRPGDNELDVKLIPEITKETSMTVKTENVQDLYGVLVIDTEKDVAFVRVSEGNKYDEEAYDEYKNSDYGSTGFIQRVTYTNLIPQTKYTLTVASFNEKNKLIETKTIDMTTKALYNRSEVKTDIIDFLTIGNGASVTFKSQPQGFYLICYEKSKAPTTEGEIIKDALVNGSLLESARIGYIDGLKPEVNYSIYVIPVAEKKIPDSNYYYFAPGKVTSMDVRTKSEYDMARATVVEYTSSKTSFTYYLKSSDYDPYGGSKELCLSYKKVQYPEYDQVEDDPDIVWATLCHSQPLEVFTKSTTNHFTWSNLNLSSWYGIITLGYRYASGDGNSSVISRYKFKYGVHGETTRSAEPTLGPVQTSGIKYGTISNDLLKRVHVLN